MNPDGDTSWPTCKHTTRPLPNWWKAGSSTSSHHRKSNQSTEGGNFGCHLHLPYSIKARNSSITCRLPWDEPALLWGERHCAHLPQSYPIMRSVLEEP